jgi:pimeloyl-ACP methyl ester carboxylesterase
MKLILLPGMDGTGRLFFPLVNLIPDIDVEIIPLPETGPQDYDSLTEWVGSKLPATDFVLLAESFSGPIAAKLSRQNHPHIRSIIFVASFLSAPSFWKPVFAKCLPLKLFSRLPGARFFYRCFFLGRNISIDRLLLFESVLASVPEKVLKARLTTISRLACRCEGSNLPVTYIQALDDQLVASSKVQDFLNCYTQLKVVNIKSPHFVLQARPEEAAKIIRDIVEIYND